MGFMDGLKALVTKGPAGFADNMMKDQMEWQDRYNAADKTDPVVMKALMEEQRQNMNARIAKYGSGFVSENLQGRLNSVFDNVGENQAAMHQVLEAQKARMAAEASAKMEAGLPPETK